MKAGHDAIATRSVKEGAAVLPTGPSNTISININSSQVEGLVVTPIFFAWPQQRLEEGMLQMFVQLPLEFNRPCLSSIEYRDTSVDLLD